MNFKYNILVYKTVTVEKNDHHTFIPLLTIRVIFVILASVTLQIPIANFVVLIQVHNGISKTHLQNVNLEFLYSFALKMRR